MAPLWSIPKPPTPQTTPVISRPDQIPHDSFPIQLSSLAFVVPPHSLVANCFL
ncbi:hypothetical protein BJY04DRAFT_195848 [Aspergillus karnatakaensis]|uniref:uncharacterized protein n=1 Tax=Aspergillus karnatakaensis TaxID=1810916 RepID=UPI003CCE2094